MLGYTPEASGLQDHARRRVLLPAFMQSPPSHFAPLWPMVHGEERINLPALPELLPALWELEIYPDLVMFGPEPAETVHGREAGLALLRRFLFVRPGSEQERLLEAAMGEWVVETPRGVSMRGARPRRQGLLAWRPAEAG
jgi:hypothetical protein